MLTIGAHALTMGSSPHCAATSRSGHELARYLIDYDPAGDPRSDITDETPLTRRQIDALKTSLVESGFFYPNGQASVITWMDFNADGICDFTASAGIGGTRSIDRMFLFRGLRNTTSGRDNARRGEFRLAHAHLDYMDGTSTLVPYIPLTLSGDKLPVLATVETLLQWRSALGAFASCDSIQYGVQARRHRSAAPALAQLCPHASVIYQWAAAQLPHANEVSQMHGVDQVQRSTVAQCELASACR